MPRSLADSPSRGVADASARATHQAPPPSSEIELEADAEQQRRVHRHQSRMEHLEVWREVTPGRDPQVVEEFDPPLVPEPRHLALGLRAGPELVEPDAKRVPLAARQRAVPAEGCAQEPTDRVRVAVAEARLDVQAQAP